MNRTDKALNRCSVPSCEVEALKIARSARMAETEIKSRTTKKNRHQLAEEPEAEIESQNVKRTRNTRAEEHRVFEAQKARFAEDLVAAQSEQKTAARRLLADAVKKRDVQLLLEALRVAMAAGLRRMTWQMPGLCWTKNSGRIGRGSFRTKQKQVNKFLRP